MRVGVLLLVVLMAGCLQDAEVRQAPPLEVTPLATPVTWSAACTAPLMVVSPAYEDVAAALPAGFHPGDPQEVFETPVALGRGIVLFMAVHCPDIDGSGPTTMAFTGPLIESPAGYDELPGFDLYALTLGAQGWLAEQFAAHDWNMSAGEPVVGPYGVFFPPVPGTYSASVHYPLAVGNATWSTVSVAPYTQEEFIVRLWQADDAGRRYWHFTSQGAPLLGDVDCSYPEGSVEARLLGGSTCYLARYPTFGGAFVDFQHDAGLVQVTP